MTWVNWIAIAKAPVDLAVAAGLAAKGQWPLAVMFFGFAIADIGAGLTK